MENEHKGLAGIVAGRTAISTVETAGSGLFYRGYSINDLAEHASFEETAHLLIHGELPSSSELETRNGWMPISRKRVTVPGASLVCRVLNSR